MRVFTSLKFEKFGDTSTTNLVSFVQSVELRNCRNFETDISNISNIYIHTKGEEDVKFAGNCYAIRRKKKKKKKRNGTKVLCELLDMRLYTLKREK